MSRRPSERPGEVSAALEELGKAAAQGRMLVMCGPAAVGTLERAALVLVTAIVESTGYVVPAARMRLSAMSSSMGADVLLSVEAAAVASGRAAAAIYAAVSRGQIARHWNATGQRYRVRLGDVMELRTRPRRRLPVSIEPESP